MKAEYIDHMGDDLTVVNAARVSFNKQSSTLSEKDQKLIKYLARNGHWTPFSHVQIQMRETVPLFVARQRFKHSVGFTYNEVSGRYIKDPPSFYVPDVWRGGPTDGAKQGSSEVPIKEFKYYDPIVGPSPYNVSINTEITNFFRDCGLVYDSLIRSGVAPEQARIILPQSTYTSYYVTGSLPAWSRAYKLRIAKDAQKEIRELSKQWDEIIRSIPELKHSWEALIGS